jgi:tetratricopeptide (TPR) repeat protein
MKRNLLLLLFLQLLFLSCSKSNEELKLESDKLFNQAIDYYERGYLNQSADLFKEVVNIETKLGGIQRRANSYIYLGLIYYQLSDFYQSMDSYQKALQDFQSLKDKRSELLVLNNIAGIHSLLGEYEKALNIYSDVVGKSLIFADKESEAIASLNIGDVYQEMWDFDVAFDYFNKAFDPYEILGDLKGKIFTLNKIGELFIASKNFSNAIKSFDMAIEIQNKNGSNYLKQDIYNNIGLIYFYQKQISRAKEFFEAALNLSSSSESNQLILIAIRNNLGDCDFQSGSYSRAIDNYKEALALSEQSFLKFLSPILQLKLAISYEKLYFINHNDADKKNAERFYQFAINRFEENRDEENLNRALSSIASFYVRIGEKNKAKKYYEKLYDLAINISLKPDEHLRPFAIKPDFDFAFLQALIEEEKFDQAYRIIYLKKVKDLFEYFLRFRDFNFFDDNTKETLQKFKNEILALNTYQQILRQELSLPSSQRIKEKYNKASKFCDEKSQNVEEYLKSLSEKFIFLKPLKEKNFKNLIEPDDKIFVEFYPAGENLIYFIIGKKGIQAKTLKADLTSLNFNSNIILKNINTFSIDQVVNFSRDNLSWLIDDLLKSIEQNFTSVKEISFLLNGSELDFVPHLIYSKRLNDFLRGKYFISYSYLPISKSNAGDIKSFAILSQCRLVDFEDLRRKDKTQLVSRDKTLSDKSKLRVGLRDENTNKINNEDFGLNKHFDAVFVHDRLFINETSPELIYIQSSANGSNLKSKSSERIYLKEIFRLSPGLILLKNFDVETKSSYLNFLSLFSLLKPAVIIFPITNTDQELSENFLYNYKERAENKNLREASTIFWKMIQENQKDGFKNFLIWINFTN